MDVGGSPCSGRIGVDNLFSDQISVVIVKDGNPSGKLSNQIEVLPGRIEKQMTRSGIGICVRSLTIITDSERR